MAVKWGLPLSCIGKVINGRYKMVAKNCKPDLEITWKKRRLKKADAFLKIVASQFYISKISIH